VLDPVRTAMYLRAVDEALRELLARFPGETIGVVYAGTGPLAPLLLPLLPRFRGEPIAVTLIDLHEEAIESVRTLAGSLVDTSIALELVCGDACAYEQPSERRLHLVVTETMQRALTREPQVAITRQLARQLVPGGLFVPESVRVDLVIGTVREGEAGGVSSPAVFRDERFVGTLLDLRAGVASLPVDHDGCLPPVLMTIPPGVPSSGAVALFRTRITTLGDHRIGDDESGLTLPELASDVGPLEPGCELEFRYRIGRQPGFVWRRLERPELTFDTAAC